MQPLSLLLVEDHRDTADVLSLVLRKLNYDVTAANGYQSALDKARARRFDLLLTDIGLPDGDGCELLAELRKLYPIDGIAISGYGMPQDIERCLVAGFVTHLVKPVEIALLKDVIEH